MNPNCQCTVCEKPLYRKPNELQKFKGICYCSKECRKINQTKTIKQCLECNKDFKNNSGNARPQKFCSKSCATIYVRKQNRWSTKARPDAIQDASRNRIKKLHDAFGFLHCMVEGCQYNKTYDVHRLIPGKNGGKYEIGNMFAICPNHHAEYHRNIITLEKINDFTLKAVEHKTISEG